MQRKETKFSRINPVAVITALVAMSIVVFYFFVDPENTRIMPRCVFHVVTGFNCAGCGAQRMLHALLHFDFGSAFHANPFLFLSIPVVLFLVWLEMYRKRYSALYSRIYTPPFIVAAGILLILWTVIRNIIGV